MENFFEGAATGQWPIQESVVEGLKIGKKKISTSAETHDRGERGEEGNFPLLQNSWPEGGGGGQAKPKHMQQKMYSKKESGGGGYSVAPPPLYPSLSIGTGACGALLGEPTAALAGGLQPSL